MKAKKILRAIWCIFACVCLTLLGLGLYRVIHDASFVEVEARVTRVYMVGTTPDSNGKYYAEYEYEVDGVPCIGKRQLFWGNGSTRKGQTETVRYDPSAPTELENTVLKGAFFGVGAFFALLCLLLFKPAWMKRR